MIATLTKLFDSTQRSDEIDEDQDMEFLDKDLALEMDILNGLSGRAKKKALSEHQKLFDKRERNEFDDEFTQEIANARATCARKRSSTSNPNHRKLMSMDEIKAEAEQISKRGWCWLQ